jgi:hypothetical protein
VVTVVAVVIAVAAVKTEVAVTVLAVTVDPAVAEDSLVPLV